MLILILLYHLIYNRGKMLNIQIEKIHKTHNYTLLKKVYYDILLPCFPNPKDHLSWFKVKWMLNSNFKSETDNDRILLLISKRILKNGTEEPISFLLGVYYKKSQTGLISYMGVRPGEEKSADNIQKQLLSEMEDTATLYNKKVLGVFSMVDLPEYVDSRYITIDPVLRIKIMERHGGHHIPIDFQYPSFGTSLFSYLFMKKKYKRDAALLGYRLYGKLPTETPEIIHAFIEDFYESYDIDPNNDPMVKKMQEEVNSLPLGIKVRLSKHYKKGETNEKSNHRKHT